jgi:antitoxin component YwqK of YwqJK toxin-antitoxin module
MRTPAILLLFMVWWGCSSQSDDSTVDAGTVEVKKQDGKTRVDGVLFSGYLLMRFENGDTASLESFVNGNQHGQSRYWYRNGQLKEDRSFKDNRKHGLHKGWYASGIQGFEYRFEDGVYVDTLREWYDNGQLYLKSHYVNGQQEGRQQAWKRDGELYMNYDVKNGRKYGNAGIKHCKSLWSDVVAGM